MIFFKSLQFTLVGLVAGLVGAGLAARLDRAFELPTFSSLLAFWVGVLILAVGIILRFWATYLFYQHDLRVVAARPQEVLLTTGPYRFSRNPHFLSIILIFLGAAFILGSPAVLILTALSFWLLNSWVKREERALTAKFGEEYRKYQQKAQRWVYP